MYKSCAYMSDVHIRKFLQMLESGLASPEFAALIRNEINNGFIRQGSGKSILKETGHGPFFDNKGRCRFPKGINFLATEDGGTVPSSHYAVSAGETGPGSLSFDRIEVDYRDRWARFARYFPEEGGKDRSEEFRIKSEILLVEISKNTSISGLLGGPHYPICISGKKTIAAGFDYGSHLAGFLSAAKEACLAERQGMVFWGIVDSPEDLKNRISLVPSMMHSGRHERLAMKMIAAGNDFLVGIYFPSPFLGWSLDGVYQMMPLLPGELLMAGGFDIASAMATYPDILACGTGPDIDFGAISYLPKPQRGYFEDEPSHMGLCFHAEPRESGSVGGIFPHGEAWHAQSKSSAGLLYFPEWS